MMRKTNYTESGSRNRSARSSAGNGPAARSGKRFASPENARGKSQRARKPRQSEDSRSESYAPRTGRNTAGRKTFDRKYSGKDNFRPERETRGNFGKRNDSPRDGFERRRPGFPKKRTLPEFRPAKKETVAKENDGLVRLNKFIANSGICSRREADQYIKEGLISVNGKIVTEMGVKVSEKDDIRFNGERLKGEKKVYIVMNKPKDVVTTVSDPHADRTVIDLIQNKCKERVFPVGRLDKSTTGVLLLTNDGELAEKLTHPSYEKKKIYQVTLDRNMSVPDLEHLTEGMILEDGPIFADAASYIDGDKSMIGIEIHSGRNRIVRRMFEHLGYKVRKLDRVYFAGITKKKLRRGEWRFLTDTEVGILKAGMYE